MKKYVIPTTDVIPLEGSNAVLTVSSVTGEVGDMQQLSIPLPDDDLDDDTGW